MTHPLDPVQTAIRRLVSGEDLERPAAHDVVLAIMGGDTTPAQVAAILVAWRMKGETSEELVGAVEAMRARATRVVTRRTPVVDTCGTGGDGAGTFNISTAAAIVAAAAGTCVAKHGNRAVSSACGSADVLEALGVAIDLGAEDVGRCLDELGLGFLYAPRFHPAMRHAAAPRREIGVRTLFNLLGPLANPAGATRQVVGVYSLPVARLVAAALARLGTERALVVHGDGGLDELNPSGPNHVFAVEGGAVRPFLLEPEAAGIARRSLRLAGGSAPENARHMVSLLAGEDEDLLAAVALNAGAAIFAAGQVPTIADGVEAARAAVHSGAARAQLAELRRLTRSLASRQTEPPAGAPADSGRSRHPRSASPKPGVAGTMMESTASTDQQHNRPR